MQSWLNQSPENKVDLIYLDPPFNSKTNYNYLYGTQNGVPAQVRAFPDTWKWGEAAQERLDRFHHAIAHPARKAVLGLEAVLGPSGMLAYLTYMAERLELMRHMLRDSGSIYLHCDPTASHYLKIVMDTIFGPKNFLNEIIWSYRTGGASKKWWPRKHDTILFYQKSNKYRHNPEKEKVSYEKAFFGTSIDSAGQHYTDVYVRDVWDTIKPLINVSKERLGYPTQKPRALLERIVEASSNKGDLVLDPFCGCGTTIDAAERLGRPWIGIDISPFATGLIRNVRLKNSSIPIHGIPTDMEGAKKLLKSNHFHFEAWCITSIPGLVPNEVQVGDGGVDGRGFCIDAYDDDRKLILAQVKGGGYATDAFKAFQHVLTENNALAGIFITLDSVSDRIKAKAVKRGKFKAGATFYPRLQFFSVKELLGGKQPNLPPMADPKTGKPLQADFFM